MEEKYVSELMFLDGNKYKIKDAEARESISDLNTSVENLDNSLNQVSGNVTTTQEGLDTANNNIKTTNDRIDTTNQNLSNLNTQLGLTNGELENVKQDLNTTNENLDGLEVELQTIRENGIVIVGDSFTAMDTASVNTRGGADTWVTEFSRIMNKKCYNYAEGGAGFYKNSVVDGKNNNFHQQLSVAAQDETFDNSLITDIIVYGGVNDMSIDVSLAQYEVGLDGLKTVADEHFPNARVHIFAFNNGSAKLDSSYNYSDIDINTIHEFYKMCSEHGFVVHKATSWLDGDASVWANALHPNEYGVARICNFMVQSFTGGDGLEIKLNLSDFKLITSDGEFDMMPYHVLGENGLFFNPFTGRLHGSVLVEPTGGWGQITNGLSGTYKMIFDAPGVSYSSICIACNCDNLKVNLGSYIQPSASNVIAGVDFYNGESTPQTLTWFAFTVDSYVII